MKKNVFLSYNIMAQQDLLRNENQNLVKALNLVLGSFSKIPLKKPHFP